MRARTKGRSLLTRVGVGGKKITPPAIVTNASTPGGRGCLLFSAIAPLSVAALLATTALIHPVFAQGSVQQFGAVTQNHPAVWLQNGAIGDGGTYPNGLLSAVGVTSNNSKSVWINDVSSQIGQPYHQFTMGLSPTTGAILDYEPIAGATALPLTLTNNGFGQITLGTTGTVTIPILQVGTLNFGSFAFTNITLNGTTTNNGVITGGTITNVTMAGTLTVPKTGLRWNLANPLFASPTTSQTPLWDVEALSVSGTLGCGTLCVRAPEYDIQSENIKDTVVMNNGAFVANHHDFYFFGPSSGGKVHTILDMRQAGPITPDVTTTTSGGVAQKQSSIGVFNAWLSANNTAGGSIDGSGLVRPFGLAYGGNPKVTLGGQNLTSGVPGASMWAALVANGEVDLYIEPSQNSITLSGIVTAGDTLSISISSAVNPGFGTVTVSTVMGVGDALQFATQRLCGSIKFNTVLQASGVGAGCYGAADAVLPNQLNISWPLTSLVGTGGSTDVVITPSVSVGATETLTLGTPLAGASARLKAAQTIIQTKQDGSNGFGNDTVWYIGKQSNGAGWSSGGWRALFEIGGGGQAPFDDLLSQDIEPSSYPMRFDADMFLFVPQTNVSGAPDAPPTNISLHSFLSAGNVDFFAAAGGPVRTPGYQSFGDGSDVRGSATLQRLVGNASIAGISLTANGWEGTAVALVDGGGSNGGTADPGFLLHRYYVGARCFDAYGGGYQIDSIGTHGEVVTFHVIGDGTHFAYPSAAAGTVPATNQGVVGCGGTGWVNGITWTAGNFVRIGGAGQTVDIEGSTVIAGTITPGTLMGPITLSGTLSGGTITTTAVSGVVTTASNSTQSRSLASRAADIVNVKDFGAVGDDSTDDTVAINAAFTEARALIAAGFATGQVTSGITVVFPQPAVAYKTTTPINARGLAAYPNNAPVSIIGDGALIDCQVTSATCFDMMGDTSVTLRGLEIVGRGSGGVFPTTGFQIGRVTNASADRNAFVDVKMVGAFSVAACYIEGSEQSEMRHPFCYNGNTAANAHSLYLDASNHANITSTFSPSISVTVDNSNPFNDLLVTDGEIRNGNSASVASTVFMSGEMFRPRLLNTYVLNQGTNQACVELYTSPLAMYDVHLDIHCEQGTGTLAEEVLIDGTIAGPTIHGFHLNESFSFANTSVLALGGSVTAVNLQAADIEIEASNLSTIALFDTAANYNVYGDVKVPAIADWTHPNLFAGRLALGVVSNRYELPSGGAQNGGGYRMGLATILGTGTTDPAHSIFGGGNQTTVLTTGSYDTGFGVTAAGGLTSGSFVTAIGEGALVGDTTSPSNTGMGYNACIAVTTGAGNNICVGPSTGATLTTGSNDILVGPTMDVPAATISNYVNIGNAITGTTGGGAHPSVCVIGAPCVLAQLRSANFNVTTDQAIVVGPLTTTNNGYLPSATKYKITDIFVTNCSTSLTTAQGAFYTSASKGGTIIGATSTPYTGCTSATTQNDATSLTNMNTSIFTAATLQLSLTTIQGGAATGDVYIVGIPFN